MDKPSMEDSTIVQRYKQRLAEKKANKEEIKPEEVEIEQIDFGKYMKEFEHGRRND